MLLALGFALRGWATFHFYDQRMRVISLQPQRMLLTSGPYAWSRNPLYLGSLLIACGFALMATPWLLLAVAAFWLLVYRPVVAREAEHVRALHPEAYAAWAAHVPLFAPRLTPWRGGAGRERFDAALYWYHKEWQAGLVYVLVVAWLAFRAFGPPPAR